ncbi:uncharacterized protein MONBRDRAFT_32708 [Monosiga brevicollis MX1]|uniref:Uncharacterized protein n=1 Tax=Monosiga brevicollis TaxID=81824 RepID=A9V178_MONBE|nr:uncharacterized protein MONBRDRAFT_32708 [Monosiga brevicollis MX1]EDQ88883.1 predicted protein [Monosiga brevicollis MX1]|eukprot:XP_001746496.1 hypothetical protein [Monosiga brevicollis MX1]
MAASTKPKLRLFKPEVLRGLAEHQYSVEGRSFLDRQLQVPSWAYVLTALGLFFYQTMDNLDGKQARRTGNASPLGELFDHGCDAVSTVVVVVGVTVMLQTHDSYAGFILVVVAAAIYYATHWECYVKGRLKFHEVDVTETHYVIIGAMLLTAYFGEEFWDWTVGGLSFRFFYLFVPYIAIFGTAITLVLSIFEGGPGPEGTTIAETSILSPLMPMFALMLGVHNMQSYPSYASMPALFNLGWGCASAKLTCKLIVAHMAKVPVAQFDPAHLVPVVFMMTEFTGLSHQARCGAAIAFWCIDFLIYAFCAVLDICDGLSLNCFVVRKDTKGPISNGNNLHSHTEHFIMMSSSNHGQQLADLSSPVDNKDSPATTAGSTDNLVPLEGDDFATYMRQLDEIGYCPTELTAPIIEGALRDLGAHTTHPLQVLELAAGFGLTAAPIKFNMASFDLYQHFEQPDRDDHADAVYFSRHQKRGPLPLVVGLDTNAQALAYGLNMHLFDKILELDLAHGKLLAEEESIIAHSDIILATEPMGSVTSEVLQNIMHCFAKSGRAPPLFILFPLLCTDTTSLIKAFQDQGMLVQHAVDVAIPLHRFRTQAERHDVQHLERQLHHQVPRDDKTRDTHCHVAPLIAMPHDSPVAHRWTDWVHRDVQL